MPEHSPRIATFPDGFYALCLARDWNPSEPFLTKARARAAYVDHVLEVLVPKDWMSVVVEADQHYEEQELHDVIRMLVACTTMPIEGGDEQEHDLGFNSDGDGWNEPESESYYCSCGDWGIDWVQVDPERTGRPDPVDIALAWRKHVLATFPKDESEEEFDLAEHPH